MKIKSVDVMALKTRGADGWRPIVCRVNTDEGISGYGEAALSYGVGAPAAFGMVKDLAAQIIGMDALANEVVWDKMYKATFWGQNGGPVTFAGMSAIDIALWDIRGKCFNVPIYKLLGGKKRDKIRAYASQLQFGWSSAFSQCGKTEEYVAACKQAMAEGYDAVKIDFFTFDRDGRSFTSEETTRLVKPYYLDLIEERIAAVRETVGKGVDIIIEAHSMTDVASAIQIGKRAEKYNIFYYEEPTTPDPKLHKMVADHVNIPLASGERIYSRWQYRPYFEDGTLQVIQPDLGNCGGITEVKKICDMAATYDVGVQVHICSSPLCTAAALQLEAVIPNFCIHEHHIVNLIPWNKEFCVHDYQPVNGSFTVPELPGIGNELSDYALKTAHIETVASANVWHG
jgi:galactonate dehydratase